MNQLQYNYSKKVVRILNALEKKSLKDAFIWSKNTLYNNTVKYYYNLKIFLTFFSLIRFKM